MHLLQSVGCFGGQRLLSVLFRLYSPIIVVIISFILIRGSG
jgi:hypothetical protein